MGDVVFFCGFVLIVLIMLILVDVGLQELLGVMATSFRFIIFA